MASLQKWARASKTIAFASVILAIGSPSLLSLYRTIRAFPGEVPQPFETKIQLKGAAVWAVGTEAGMNWGEGCSQDYQIRFAQTKEPVEVVDSIKREDIFGSCIGGPKLGRVQWFGFGNGLYLSVDGTIYSRGKTQKRWRKHLPSDGANSWHLENINWRVGRVRYVRAEGKKRFFRVYQLPQKSNLPWKLLSQTRVESSSNFPRVRRAANSPKRGA